MKRLAVARLWFEGNSFSPVKTGLEIFHAREWQVGKGVPDFYRGSSTEMAASIAFAETAANWQVEFLRAASAPPGGPVTREAFAAIRAEILDGLRGQRWDAVYLSLHGAMVTEDNPVPELDLIRAVRALIGKTPLGASFDLHANLGAEMIALLDVATGYKTYPHIDMKETGARAIELVTALAEGRLSPKGALVKIPAILPSFNMRTTDGPMAEVAAMAADFRKNPNILEATIFGGFAYGDSPFAGASILVYADKDASLAENVAADLAAALTERRDRFYVSLPTPEEAIRQALANPGDKPAAITDPADNPLSGGIGDTPALFRALLEARPGVPSVFAFFCDPGLVARAHGEGVGARIDAALGGRITRDFGPPVSVTACIEKLTDGRFRNVGPYEHNLACDVGCTVLFDIAGIKVIVTEGCQTPNDPAYFALHGIELGKIGLLCVKAKNHFRAGFKNLTRIIIDVDAPGPAALNLDHYRFRFAPKSLYPLNRN